MKKIKGTMFRIIMVDFVSVFLGCILILTTVLLALSFHHSKKEYLKYNEMLLKSLENRVDSYFDGINSSSQTILSNGKLWDFTLGRTYGITEELEEQLRIMFSNLYYYSFHIEKIELYVPQNDSIYSLDSDVILNNKPFRSNYRKTRNVESDWILEASKSMGVYQYHENKAEGLDVSVALSKPFSSEAAFVFRYSLAPSFWNEMIRDLKTKDETVMFFNKVYDFSFCSEPTMKSYLPMVWEKMKEYGENSGNFDLYLKEKSLVEYSNFKESEWIVVKVVPFSAVYSGFHENVLMYGLCGLLVILFFAAISVSISKHISRPIERLTRGLSALTPDCFVLNVEYKKEDEIGMLYQKCHEIIDMVNNLVKKEYEMNIKEKEARLKILQLQLNPHFIYNVLQLLSNIAVESDNLEIEEITDAFGLLLRYNLANENRYVRVIEEIDALEKYFFIMKKTYGKRLETLIKVEENAKMQTMLPFILQPIVENSFKHGLSRKVGQIRIKVTVFIMEGNLIITVEDNGIGIDEKKIDQINHFFEEESLPHDLVGEKGLRLIQGRIEVEYGKEYGLKANSLFNIGTMITVTLPAVEKEI